MAAEQKLQQRMSSWEEQKKAKASETKKLEARCADLVNQNSTLHSQLEKVCSLIHCFYFIFARKIYLRTHVKITRQCMEIYRYTVSIGITYGWVTLQWLFEVSSVLIGHICRQCVFVYFPVKCSTGSQ